MFYYILIETADGTDYRRKADDQESIYDLLISLGCTHEQAEDCSSWAELASVGEEYEMEEPRLYIAIYSDIE